MTAHPQSSFFSHALETNSESCVQNSFLKFFIGILAVLFVLIRVGSYQ